MLNDSDQLRVCHVVLSLDVGGLERVVLDLVRCSASLGQRPMIACLSSEGALAEEARRLGADVVCLGKLSGLRPGLVRPLRQLFVDYKPDVVHTHQTTALAYAGPAAWSAGVPRLVHTEHGKHFAGHGRTRILGRFAARFVDRFFCVSSDIREEVVQCRVAPPEKVVTIPNGIDVDRYRAPADDAVRSELSIPADGLVIGTVGRLGEVKRQDVLLRAFAALRGDHPAAHLLLVGDGVERGNLELLAKELGIAAVTHFAGYRSNPEAFLPLMDVFALTSRSEGMPLAVLEAWAAGVPVVASAVGGLPEMLDEGRLGWLFPAGDHQALAALLRDVLAGGRASMADKVAAAYETVCSRYSLMRVAEDYHRHYTAVRRPIPVRRWTRAAARATATAVQS